MIGWAPKDKVRIEFRGKDRRDLNLDMSEEVEVEESHS